MPFSSSVLSNHAYSLNRLDHAPESEAVAQSISSIKNATSAIFDQYIANTGSSYSIEYSAHLGYLLDSFDVQFIRHAIEQCAHDPALVHPVDGLDVAVDKDSQSLIFKAKSLNGQVQAGLRYDTLDHSSFNSHRAHGVFRVEEGVSTDSQQLLFMKQLRPDGVRHLERYYYPTLGTPSQQKNMSTVESQTLNADDTVTSKKFAYVKELLSMQAVQVARWDHAGNPIKNEAFAYDVQTNEMQKTEDLSHGVGRTPLLARWEKTPEEHAVLNLASHLQGLADGLGVAGELGSEFDAIGASAKRLVETKLPEVFREEHRTTRSLINQLAASLIQRIKAKADIGELNSIFSHVMKAHDSVDVLRNTLAGC